MSGRPAAAALALATTLAAAAAAGAAPSPADGGGWKGRLYPTSEALYQAMRTAAHGGEKMTWPRLPDWSGLWVEAPRPMGLFDAADPDSAHSSAPLTPAYRALYEKKVADAARGIEWDPLSNCLPAGFPRWLSEPFLREFIVRPDRVLWIEEQQNEIRRLYTDGRGHTPEDEAYPLWEGDSIGFWDGDTLVVHTNHLKPGQYQRRQPDHSGQETSVERIRKAGPDTMVDDIWLYDPPSLTRPWHVHFTYDRVKTPDLRINQWSCEENTNVVKTPDGVTQFILPGEPGYKDPNSLGDTPP